MSNLPVRFQISNWTQLPNCQSNTCRDLYIRVKKFTCRQLSGTIISVAHPMFGILFSCLADGNENNTPTGTILHPDDNTGVVGILSTDEILKQLSVFGFYIEYNEEERLPENQIEYLQTLKGLHFDKIRILGTYSYSYGIRKNRQYIVAFQASKLGNWLNAQYTASKEEFLRALEDGSAINISAISDTERYNWSFLSNTVYSISDILQNQIT